MRKLRDSALEILYVAAASDDKGKRVLIRGDGCENTLWPGEELQDLDVVLWELSKAQQKRIKGFLNQ